MPRSVSRVRVVTPTSGVSRTKQSEEVESNINAIVRRYRSTNVLPVFNQRTPRYGDVSGATDFLEMQAKVRSAQEAFDSLPPNIRAYFRNDPAELLKAVYDPDRAKECRDLGLLLPGEEPAPVPESPAAPAAVESEPGGSS